MRWRRLVAEYPLRAALVFEGAMIPVALVLALVLGVTPWADFRFSRETVVLAVVATALMVALLALSAVVLHGWFREAERLVQPLVDTLFRGRGPGPVVAVCGLAGVGEELLFRGVLQAWLAGLTGTVSAVVLAAVVFGAVHYLSRAYFVMATLIGVYLGALYELSGNLVVPILVHALYDALAVAYVLVRHERPGRSGAD